MGIYFYLFPVDADALVRDEAWLDEYTGERSREFWEWEDLSAPEDDPRGQVVLRYQSHYVDLINPYLEAAYDLEPYSWFAGEQVSEFYFVTPPDQVAALAATLARPADDVRERLEELARTHLDMVGRWTGGNRTGTFQDGTVDEFWDLVGTLHAQLRDFFRRTADGGRAMIGYFSP